MPSIDFSPLWFSPFVGAHAVYAPAPETARPWAEFEAILFQFEAGAIEVMSLPDTDELLICLHTETDTLLADKGYVAHPLPHFGDRLSYAWQCRNLNGYEDLFVLAFHDLQPQLGIYSEGSYLRLLRMEQI